MTEIPLPEADTDNRAAFIDAESARHWLASQSLADSSGLPGILATQLGLYNTLAVSALSRFETFEALRTAVFSLSSECRSDSGTRASSSIPEPETYTGYGVMRHVWRACAIGYLQCLRACLAGDVTISEQAGVVAHRAVTSLRMEQLCCYQAGDDVDGTFWYNLHAAFAIAETLQVHVVPVEDALPRETTESTVSGQYSMALLLYLANPFSLTRNQFGAAVRWFARWRELAIVQEQPETKPDACCLAIDLSREIPLHDFSQSALNVRWLVLDRILRKMRKRIEALEAGAQPESLRLGKSLSPEACIVLLETLFDRLRFSPSAFYAVPSGAVLNQVASGLDNLCRLLGELTEVLDNKHR